MGARGATGYVLGRGAGSAAQWWMAAGVTPVAAYAPKGAASLAASYTNLANPGTYDAAPGVAPTWDAAGGWNFNGTQYLTTGVVPSVLGTWTAIVRFSDRGNTGAVIGCRYFSNNEFVLYPQASAGNFVGYQNGAPLNVAPLLNAGVIGFSGTTAYRNGVAEAGTITAGTLTNNVALFLGARNVGGSPQSYFSGKIQAGVIYSAILSAAQVAAVTAAMNLL